MHVWFLSQCLVNLVSMNWVPNPSSPTHLSTKGYKAEHQGGPPGNAIRRGLLEATRLPPVVTPLHQAFCKL